MMSPDINVTSHTLCIHYSFRELLDKTCQLANVLKTQGVQKGDRVVIYMPMSPLAVASMLACARIGAVHRFA